MRIDTGRTALILVDMQRCFVDPGGALVIPGAEQLCEPLSELAEACRARGVPVVLTAQVLRPDHSNAGPLAQLPEVKEGAIDDGTESAEVDPRLRTASTDVVVKKPRFGAFQGTDLELLLRGWGVDTLIVGGVETQVCCESTARDGTDRGFRVLFLADGTAAGPEGGVEPDEVQRMSLARIDAWFGDVVTVDDALDALGRE